MPVYDYMCPDCGPFTDMRPMAECALANICPDCGGDAPRAFINAPASFSMGTGERQLAAGVERSRAETPKAGHASGCGCCKPTKRFGKAAQAAAAKAN